MVVELVDQKLTCSISLSLFAGPAVPDPVDISLEYLALCRTYPGTNLSVMQAHVLHFVEFQW